jgi:hypothetical protein
MSNTTQTAAEVASRNARTPAERQAEDKGGYVADNAQGNYPNDPNHPNNPGNADYSTGEVARRAALTHSQRIAEDRAGYSPATVEVSRRASLTQTQRDEEDAVGYIGVYPILPLTKDQRASKMQNEMAAAKVISDAAAEDALR